MAERTDQRTREVDDADDLLDDTTDFDPEIDLGSGTPGQETATGQAEQSRLGGLRSRLGSPFSGLFSLKQFLVTLVLTVGAMVLVGAVLPVPGIAGLLGILLVGSGFGLLSDRPRYLEIALAGGAASGIGTLLDYLVLTVAGIGVPVVAAGAIAGVAAGVFGHYLGRDLRDGLTRDL